MPTTSGGIHSGLPARWETVTRACGSDGSRGASGSRPKIRLMQAGKYTAAAPADAVTGSVGGAGWGIGPATAGTRSVLTALRAASVSRLSTVTPTVR